MKTTGNTHDATSMKQCGKCKTVKQISSFYVDKRQKTGHSNSCKQCHREKMRLYYYENKEKLNEQHRKYRLENKEKINQRVREYRDRNKEQVKKSNSLYYAANRERLTKVKRERYRAMVEASMSD